MKSRKIKTKEIILRKQELRKTLDDVCFRASKSGRCADFIDCNSCPVLGEVEKLMGRLHNY